MADIINITSTIIITTIAMILHQIRIAQIIECWRRRRNQTAIVRVRERSVCIVERVNAAWPDNQK